MNYGFRHVASTAGNVTKSNNQILLSSDERTHHYVIILVGPFNLLIIILQKVLVQWNMLNYTGEVQSEKFRQGSYRTNDPLSLPKTGKREGERVGDEEPID